jgi:hypothetical protein
MRRCQGWAILSLIAGVACQDTGRPPPVRDPIAPTPEPGSLIDPDEPTDPTSLSSCGSATVALDFVRPNLYFALDGSGSMTEAIPAGENDDAAANAPNHRYAALARAIRALLARIGHRVNYGATLFPTGDVGCDGGEEIRSLGPGDDVSFAVSGEVGPALRTLMFNIERRLPAGGTPVALALTGVLPRLLDLGSETYVLLVTDGGPNCNSSSGCGPESCIPNIERQRITENLVCDESFNCCDASAYGPENCLDTTASVQAVQRLHDAGIRTFVVGMPGSEAYASVLDQLALAGGTARTESPRYYRVGDAEALLSVVSSLGSRVALSCSIELSEPPPDPALVNLYFDTELVVADPLNGWTFTGDRTVVVQGTACELLQSGEVLQAHVIAGCPIVIN